MVLADEAAASLCPSPHSGQPRLKRLATRLTVGGRLAFEPRIVNLYLSDWNTLNTHYLVGCEVYLLIVFFYIPLLSACKYPKFSGVENRR